LALRVRLASGPVATKRLARRQIPANCLRPGWPDCAGPQAEAHAQPVVWWPGSLSHRPVGAAPAARNGRGAAGRSSRPLLVDRGCRQPGVVTSVPMVRI